MQLSDRMLISGDEAVAVAALDTGVALGAGYPGTPSTEILEVLAQLGGPAQWSPNEKVALEVALGAAYGGARALVTLKHVGLNVAADPLFTAAYTGVPGALVIISADDPGLASSQNEQDNRRYAEAAGVPMLEPADSQEAYDFFRRAIEISERWRIPVLFRLTTRVCHSKTSVQRRPAQLPAAPPHFEHDRPGLVMIPANARPAHKRLRQKLTEIAQWNETQVAAGPAALNRQDPGDAELGLITSGISSEHAREAAPAARMFKLGLTHPLPLNALRAFAQSVKRCVVIEEGDPYLVTALRAAGIAVAGKPEMYRFGELNVERVRRILANDVSPEPAPPRGKPPQLCVGCPHRTVFEVLRQLDCIVSGDIGCYTLGVLPPFEAMDTCVCMGASLGVGLGLRHVLPEAEARRVVSVIGDSTFVHSGLTGLVEMVYNPPATGHVVLILDNGTTAMTGLQDHPGTGRRLDGAATHKVSFEKLAEAVGIQNIRVLDRRGATTELENILRAALSADTLTLVIVRSPCLLAAKHIRAAEKETRAGEAEKKD